MGKFEERVATMFADWDGSEAEFKKRKRSLQKEFHPDNQGNEILCQKANELKIEDVDFFLYDGGDRTRICGLKRDVNLACVKIPEGVEWICNDSFWHKEAWYSKESPRFNAKKVILPKSLKGIGINAFRNARRLEEVVFEHDESQMVKIWRGAFSNTCIVDFHFNCNMSMEAVNFDRNKTWNTTYTIFHNCLFFGNWKPPFDMTKVELFGEGAKKGIDGIWNNRETAETMREFYEQRMKKID